MSVRSIFNRKKPTAAKMTVEPTPPLAAVPALTPEPARVIAEPPPSARLPRFRATASDQVDRRRADRFMTMRMRLRNAFTPSQPIIDGKMFAGRQDLLSEMISSIEDRRLHLVVYGERGIGKTSLLHVLAEAAENARYIVIYSSCGATSNFQDTFRSAAAEIPLLYHTSFGPTAEEAEAGSSVADLLPEYFEARQFADVCARLAGTRVLIFLDEFDRCDSPQFRRDVAELIKFLSDRSVRVQLVIGGVAGDLAELVDHIPSIRRNIHAIHVPQMSDEEVGEMVTTGERASGLKFDPAARELISRVARGWPYIAVLLCHHAGLAALDAERDVVLEEDVSTALDAASSELRARMVRPIVQQVDRLMTGDAGRALTVMAAAALAAGGDFGLADIEHVARKPSDANAAKRVAEELASERILIERRGDAGLTRYDFIDEGLPPYLWFLGTQQSLLETQLKARVSAG